MQTAVFSEELDTKIFPLDLLSDEIDEAEPLVSIDQNPRQWACKQLLFSNPWDLLDQQWQNILTCPYPGDAFRVILEDANVQSEQTIPEFKRMLAKIIDGAENDQSRPADRYRRWMPALRFILEQRPNSPRVQALVNEIITDQSLPLDELDSPYWIDMNTGEVDMLPEERLIIGNPTSDKEESEFYSEGFNALDDLDTEFFDEYDVKLSTLDEIRQENVPTPEGVEYVRNWMKPYSDALSEHMKLCIDANKYFPRWDDGSIKKTVEKPIQWLGETPDLNFKEHGQAIEFINTEKLHDDFLNSPEAQTFIRELGRIPNAEPADIAVVWMRFQHGLGFSEDDANLVNLGGFTLADWLGEEAGEGFWNYLERGFASHGETDLKTLETFHADTLEKLAAKYEPANLEKIVRKEQKFEDTAEFMIAFISAMANAKNITYKVGDKYHNRALETAYDAVREKLSPEGNKAFRVALMDGKTPKQAMVEFWAWANNTTKVVGIRPDGLTLASGRKINWYVAALKFRNHEIKMPQSEIQRLKQKLVELGLGKELVKAL